MQGMELVRDLECRGLELQQQGKGKEVSHKTAKILFAFIYLYQGVAPALNAAKSKLDLAFQSKDVPGFETALQEFREASGKLYEVKAKLKSRRKLSRLTIHSDLFLDAMKKISFYENTISGGEQWLKEARMTPAQLEASRKASIRMQMRWGI